MAKKKTYTFSENRQAKSGITSVVLGVLALILFWLQWPGSPAGRKEMPECAPGAFGFTFCRHVSFRDDCGPWKLSGKACAPQLFQSRFDLKCGGFCNLDFYYIAGNLLRMKESRLKMPAFYGRWRSKKNTRKRGAV